MLLEFKYCTPRIYVLHNLCKKLRSKCMLLSSSKHCVNDFHKKVEKCIDVKPYTTER